ncbi:MAG: PIG-L family deacetylase [Chloroflexi bacterium]|nr:PIG-L family deacetylase [Chloroflexota bacterium]
MQRALAVAAHPDDIEFSSAATISKLVQSGCDVTYAVVTNGDKGTDDPDIQPARLAEIRAEEQRNAARVLGVREVVFLGYEDGTLWPSLELRKQMVRLIRRFQPDLVMTYDPMNRYFVQRYINHPDHRIVGDAVLDAVYPSARDRLVFPELLEEGLEPHKVRHVMLWMPAMADLIVDIGDSIDVKVEALREHRSQTQNRDLDSIVRERAALFGQPHGVALAEIFKYIHLP